jgi:hypothetical protein
MSDFLGAVADLLISTPRSFGGVIPDVVTEESHMDNLAITEHPVEMGAPISDHAYLRPAEVKVRMAWSPSSPAIPGFLGSLLPVSAGLVSGVNQLFNGGGNYLKEVYEELLALQASRQPFDLTTGKRDYRNMLIESLAVETDKEKENILFVSISFREVIIVRSLTANSTAPQAEPAAQAAPQETAPPQDQGTRQPTPAPAAAAPEAVGAPPPPTPTSALPPTASATSPTGWRDAAGVPVERDGTLPEPLDR